MEPFVLPLDMRMGVGEGEAVLPGGVGDGPIESSSIEKPFRDSFFSEFVLLWKGQQERRTVRIFM